MVVTKTSPVNQSAGPLAVGRGVWSSTVVLLRRGAVREGSVRGAGGVARELHGPLVTGLRGLVAVAGGRGNGHLSQAVRDRLCRPGHGLHDARGRPGPP